MSKTVRWLVILTGIYDLLLGTGQIGGALDQEPVDQATWLPSMMIGAFLIFCGVVIIWSAQNLTARGPALLWQALVRLFAVMVILIGATRGYVPAALVQASTVAAFIDAAIAAFYFVALFVILKLPPIRTLLGRSG